MNHKAAAEARLAEWAQRIVMDVLNETDASLPAERQQDVAAQRLHNPSKPRRARLQAAGRVADTDETDD